MDVAKNEDSGHPLSPSVPKGNTSAPTPPHRQLRDGATSRYFSPSRISLLPDVSMGSSVLSPSAGPVRSQAASGNAACSPQTPQTCVNQTSLSPPSRFLSSSIDMVRSSGSRRHGRVPDHYSASRIGELSNDFCLGECVSPIPSLLDLKTPLEKEVMGFQNRFPDSTVAIECGYRLRFFGRCAEVASQVLGVLVNRRPGRVPSASVPTHRVVVHLRRLLEAGQKVVLIRQAEYASLRKRKLYEPDSPQQRNFVRVVAGIFTPGLGVSESHPAVSDLLQPRRPSSPEVHKARDESLGNAATQPHCGYDSGDDDQCECEADNVVRPSDEDGDSGTDVFATSGATEESWIVCLSELHGIICIVALNTQSQVLRHLSFAQNVCYEMLFSAIDQLKPKEIIFPQHGLSEATRSCILLRYSGALFVSCPVSPSDATPPSEYVPKRAFASSSSQVLRITEVPGCSDALDSTLSVMSNHEMKLCYRALMLYLDSVDPLHVIAKGNSKSQTSGYTRSFSEDPLRDIILNCDHQNWNGLSHDHENDVTFAIDPVTARDLSLVLSYSNGDYKASATVFEVMDSCYTASGSSLLLSWLTNPLTRYDSIMARQECVTWLTCSSSDVMLAWKSAVIGILKTCRGLRQFSISLRRLQCSRARFARMVETLSEVSMRLHLLQRNLKCEMPYIFDRVHKLNLEEFSRKCKQLLCCLAFPNEASSDSKFTYEYQRAHAPDLIQLQDSIHDIQKHLNEELACIRSLLHLDTLEFVTMRYGQLTLDYVVEVPKANTDVIHRVPSHWCLVSSTKSLRRYQTPNVMAFCAQLDSAKASLHIATRRAWQEFLRKAVAEIASELDRLDYFLCEMDALLSLSRLASLPGYVRPQFHPPPVNADHEEFHSIHIMGGRHIIIDHLLTCSKTKVGMESSSIPNDVRLSRLGDVDPRSIVLSGPNMGGKSVYTSMIATIVILAQMGSFVPAERVDMCVVDAVLSANSNKHFSDIPRGLSSFAAELDRIKYVLSKASDRSLVIVDELGRGASVLDGSAVAVAVLEHLTTVTRCMSIFVTHFPLVSSHAVAPLSRCFHMDCLTIDASGDQKERIVFLFKLVPGAVPSSLGFHVARLAGLDEALIEKAVELSAKL